MISRIRRPIRFSFLTLLILLLAATVCPNFAGDEASSKSTVTPAKSEKTEKWQIDDFILTEMASQFDISPDGKWAVWVKSVADKDKDGRFSNLILTSLTEKKEIELTRGKENHSSPKFSPHGQLLAFVSARPDPLAKAPTPAAGSDGPVPQLWLINPFGGEPWALTSGHRAVMSFDWADDDSIVFAAQEDPTQYEASLKEKKDNSNVVDDEAHVVPVRLYKAQVKSKTVTRLTDNRGDRIQMFELSHDGTKAIAVVQRSLSYVYDERIKPATFLYDLATRTRKQLFVEEKLNPVQFRWALDGKTVYVVSRYSSDPQYLNATISRLYSYDVETGKTTEVNLNWENGLSGGGLEVTPDGFICNLANGALHKQARYSRGSGGTVWTRAWLEGDHVGHIWQMTAGRDGHSLVYAFSTASTPAQWYRATLDGSRIVSPVQITDLNPNLNKRVIARSEVVRWRGALDEEVEGILYYPHAYEAGKKYPLLLMIHGGPAGADFDSWSQSFANPVNLMAERGAFVLRPNYHGSSNYGLKWVESISGGKYYDLEVPDIEKGVDTLIARGLVDPDKLGTMGWSNGAILSIALTVSTDRYKVCSAGAGDVDWTSDWGNAHFGAAFDNYYFGKSPLEDPMLYIRKSPFFKMDRVKTPTIIFFGTVDTNVPTEQGWLHFRALQQLGKTDVKFILFPGEPHGPQKLSHQRRKLEEDLAWIDKYLFKTAKETNEALKPNSPLAVAIKKKTIKKSGAHLGEAFPVDDQRTKTGKSILVPEVVARGPLEIGRFEVTRAQYAAFERAYTFDAGTEDYPANNIPFEKAKAYCEWLSQTTGKTYRLPRVEELEPLASAAKSGENTLDYWAGYSVNPDDTLRLRKAISELAAEQQAPLLQRVGSFQASGNEDQELIFDVGGNVAEWAMTKEGTGKAVGGSADTPGDSKVAPELRKPSPAYIGFRVARGTPAVDLKTAAPPSGENP
ncbi:MAG: prolyl oligopeptidase family serine peptidase [Acidobacteriia bacterium]|nr:prolyl oligopeptidase family serine peptidase [Terriglobia bacterium]